MFTTDGSAVPVAFLVQCHVADSIHLTSRYKNYNVKIYSCSKKIKVFTRIYMKNIKNM